MAVGILAGLLAGAFWGLVFVAPRIVVPFTGLDLSIGRYAVFGIVSLFLMLHPKFRPARITRQLLLSTLLLGLTGYVCYYLSVAYAVQLAGAAIPPLVVGALPVLMAIIGNWNEKGVPWKRLAFPLCLIALGIAVVNVATILQVESFGSAGFVFLGFVSATVALCLWLTYAIANAKAVRSPDAPGSLPWTCLQGLGAGLGILVLLPFTGLESSSALAHVDFASTEMVTFIIWALILGIASTWLATWLWIVASQRLPLALLAQLIVSETIFALIFGFAYEARWPTVPEWIGILLQLIGVVSAIALFMQKPVTQPQPEAIEHAA